MGALPFLFMTGGPLNSIYYYAGKDEKKKEEMIQGCWQLSFLSSLLILVGYLFTPQLSTIMGLSIPHVKILLLSSFVWSTSSHFGESQIALGKTVRGSLYVAFFEILKASSFIFIALKYKNLDYVFLSFLTVYSIRFLVTISLGKKVKTISFKLKKDNLKEIYFYCLPISLSAFLGFSLDKIDQLILSSSLSKGDFAYYSLGCLMIPQLILLDTSVQKVLLPKLAELYEKGQKSKAAAAFKKGISNISYLMVPAVCGLIFFAEPIITLLYTDKYLISVPFLQVFSLGYLLHCIPHDAIPRASGNTKWIFKMYLFITPISILLIYIAAKNLTPLQTLFVAILVKTLPKVIGLIYSKRLMNWSLLEMIPFKNIFKYCILAISLSYACLLSQSLFTNSLVWFFVCGPIIAVLYIGYFTLIDKRIFPNA
jgi:O-antigen/teichoic acid export membrane protein